MVGGDKDELTIGTEKNNFSEQMGTSSIAPLFFYFEDQNKQGTIAVGQFVCVYKKTAN